MKAFISDMLIYLKLTIKLLIVFGIMLIFEWLHGAPFDDTHRTVFIIGAALVMVMIDVERMKQRDPPNPHRPAQTANPQAEET